jgi:serine/threonine protein kinase
MVRAVPYKTDVWSSSDSMSSWGGGRISFTSSSSGNDSVYSEINEIKRRISNIQLHIQNNLLFQNSSVEKGSIITNQLQNNIEKLFEKADKIGSGGFATVKKININGTDYAVKRNNNNTIQTNQLQNNKWIREMNISSPYLLKMFGTILKNSSVYSIMEYLDKKEWKTLEEFNNYIEKDRQKESIRSEICKTLKEVIKSVHELGFFLLDIKPENIMIKYKNQSTQANKQSTQGNKQSTQGNMQSTQGNMQSTQGNKQSTQGNKQSTQGNMQSTQGNKQSTQGNIEVKFIDYGTSTYKFQEINELYGFTAFYKLPDYREIKDNIDINKQYAKDKDLFAIHMVCIFLNHYEEFFKKINEFLTNINSYKKTMEIDKIYRILINRLQEKKLNQDITTELKELLESIFPYFYMEFRDFKFT